MPTRTNIYKINANRKCYIFFIWCTKEIGKKGDKKNTKGYKKINDAQRLLEWI